MDQTDAEKQQEIQDAIEAAMRRAQHCPRCGFPNPCGKH